MLKVNTKTGATAPHNLAWLGIALLILQGCSLMPSYEPPKVAITGLRTVPTGRALPDFEIDLRVVNPNRQSLPIEGISYTISLGGNEILTGVGNDFPTVEGYGQQDLTITASANLLAGIRLVTDLLRAGRDSVDYDIEARLDLGGLRPTLRVRDEGTLSLSSFGR